MFLAMLVFRRQRAFSIVIPAPIAKAIADPMATLIHDGPPVCCPVRNPSPVSHAAHNRTPTALNAENLDGWTPARPAVPATIVRPKGMKRATTIAIPLAAWNLS